MKRTLAWLAGLVGIAALGRWLAARRHQDRAQEPAPAPATPAAGDPADDPAAELRRRLAASREAGGEETTPDAPAETLDERRARIHEKARAAIDAMGDDGPA